MLASPIITKTLTRAPRAGVVPCLRKMGSHRAVMLDASWRSHRSSDMPVVWVSVWVWVSAPSVPSAPLAHSIVRRWSSLHLFKKACSLSWSFLTFQASAIAPMHRTPTSTRTRTRQTDFWRLARRIIRWASHPNSSWYRSSSMVKSSMSTSSMSSSLSSSSNLATFISNIAISSSLSMSMSLSLSTFPTKKSICSATGGSALRCLRPFFVRKNGLRFLARSMVQSWTGNGNGNDNGTGTGTGNCLSAGTVQPRPKFGMQRETG
mmetsp:Transcript_28240/g.66292  ORF Transcript_28240/g.66292 Transcript_28240/m.66292 type:complete len:263 (-) Transcript_28240:120-908(-)